MQSWRAVLLNSSPHQVVAVSLESHWKYFLDASPDALFVVGPDGRIRYASAQAEHLFGFAREELIGQPVEVLLPKELAEAHRGYRESYMSDPTVRPMSLRPSLRARRKDGQLFPTHISLSPVEVDGEPSVLASVRDITELDEMRAKLERSQEHLRKLIEHMPDAVGIHRDGKFVYVNPTMARYLGYETADDLVDTPVLEIVHPDDRAMATERLATMARTGQKTSPVEERLLRRDGSSILVELHVRPMEFEGKPSFVFIGRDVSKKQELLVRAMQLDRKIAVGTLAGGVAHEINNPLAYAKANVDFVLRDLRRMLDGEAESLSKEKLTDMLEALTDTADGIKRIGRIVSDLDTFVDRQSGEQVAVDVERLLRTSVSLVFRHQQPHVRVVHDGGDIPCVNANRAQLAEVFINLLNNALVALEQSEREPKEVRVTTRTSGEAFIIVEIADNGPGMPADVLTRAFDPFYSTRDEGEGTGLGLTIVQNTVRSLGGTVEIDSAPGEGTTVRLRLPTESPRDA
jgi:PAS domain S-box-containing protein